MQPSTPNSDPLPKSPGRVLVVDDHPGVRASLRQLLASAGYEVFDVPTVEDGLTALAQHGCEIVLLDLLLPGMQGLDGLAAIKSHAPGTQVIVISGNATVDVAVACMKRGARDVLTKPLDAELVLRVVATARDAQQAEQRAPQPLGLTDRVGPALRTAAEAWALSTRQADVLGALAIGLSNKTIAQRIGCAESTVELHVTALLKKTQVSGRSELIAKFWTTF